jgi:hypothetical protein
MTLQLNLGKIFGISDGSPGFMGSSSLLLQAAFIAVSWRNDD